jgi:hypothetical protein
MRRLLITLLLMLAATEVVDAQRIRLFWFRRPAVEEPAPSSTPCTDAENAGTARYVRQGANGSGTGLSWTNATTDLPATLVRGRTYCLAEGTYAGKTFSTAASGTTKIQIVRATTADHGSSDGWVSTYGDGYWAWNSTGTVTPVNGGGVTINGVWVFQTSYWTIDGNTDVLERYGFHWDVVEPSSSWRIRIGVSVDELVGIDLYDFMIDGHGEVGSNGLQVEGLDDAIFSNFWIWGTDADAYGVKLRNSTIQHCRIGPRESSGTGEHGDGMTYNANSSFGLVGNVTSRYCKINWGGQAAFFDGSTAAPVNPHHGAHYMYGNIWYSGDAGSKCLNVHSNVISAGADRLTLYFYNNVCDNSISSITGYGGAGEFRNNIFWDTTNPGFGSATQSHNLCETGLTRCSEGTGGITTSTDPFTNQASNDYTLSAARTGFVLSSPFNFDLLGTERGLDGTFDIGAYEH